MTALATITALRNTGLHDFEITASVHLIVAQRLVRRLCLKCRKEGPPLAGEAKWLQRLSQPVPQKTWRAADCPECSMTGYRGRLDIFEVWRLHEEEADLILQHADEHTLRRRLKPIRETRQSQWGGSIHQAALRLDRLPCCHRTEGASRSLVIFPCGDRFFRPTDPDSL